MALVGVELETLVSEPDALTTPAGNHLYFLSTMPSVVQFFRMHKKYTTLFLRWFSI